MKVRGSWPLCSSLDHFYFQVFSASSLLIAFFASIAILLPQTFFWMFFLQLFFKRIPYTLGYLFRSFSEFIKTHTIVLHYPVEGIYPGTWIIEIVGLSTYGSIWTFSSYANCPRKWNCVGEKCNREFCLSQTIFSSSKTKRHIRNTHLVQYNTVVPDYTLSLCFLVIIFVSSLSKWEKLVLCLINLSHLLENESNSWDVLFVMS